MPLILTLYIEKHQSYKAFVSNLLWRHIDDVIEALNLKTNDLLNKTRQSISCYQIWAFYSEKHQSYKAFVNTYYDVITSL